MSGGEPLGSAAQEAARLFAAVEEWARTRGADLLDGAGLHAGSSPLDAGHLATGDVPCTVCPLCQGVSLLRQVKPETVEHLLDAAASVVAAVRSTVPAPGAPPAGDDPGRPPRVEHIDVREG